MPITVDLNAPWLQKSKAFATVVQNLLENIVTVNRLSIRLAKASGKPLPKLYESGIYYQSEPEGYDSFADIYSVLRLGHGDCAHLAAWRIAELREEGKQATFKVEWRETLPPLKKYKVFHIQVRHPSGRVEDPSAILGMRDNQKVTG